METKKEIRKNIVFFKLLNDKEFWEKFKRVCLSQYRIDLFSNYKTTMRIPGRKTLESFIEQDYKFMTWDERSTRDIMLYLLSEEKWENKN